MLVGYIYNCIKDAPRILFPHTPPRLIIYYKCMYMYMYLGQYLNPPSPQLYEAEMAAVMLAEYEKGEELEREREAGRWQQSHAYHQQLEGQLEEQERRKQEAYEEFLKEKLMIDEIVRKIYEEDQRYMYMCACVIV